MSPGLTRLVSLPYYNPGKVALSYESGQHLAGVQQRPRTGCGTSQKYHRIIGFLIILLFNPISKEGVSA